MLKYATVDLFHSWSHVLVEQKISSLRLGIIGLGTAHGPTSKVQYAHSTTPRPLVKSQLWTTSGGTCEKDFHSARFFDILRFFVISVSVVSVRSLQMDWHEAHHSAPCARPSYTACLGLSKNRARTVPVLCCHRCSLWGESEAGKQSNPQANPRAYAENDMKNSSLSSLSYILSSLQPFLACFGYLRIDLSLKWLIEVFDRPWPERLRSKLDPWTCPGIWSEVFMISFGFMLDKDRKIQISSMAHVAVNKKVVKLVEYWRKEDGLRKE